MREAQTKMNEIHEVLNYFGGNQQKSGWGRGGVESETVRCSNV